MKTDRNTENDDAEHHNKNISNNDIKYSNKINDSNDIKDDNDIKDRDDINMEKIYHDFEKIKNYFSALDSRRKESGNPLHYDTEFGIWGPSGMDEAFELFKKISLQKYNRFLDLGSGDGRISLIAALFTRSTGIEADEKLTMTAVSARESLGIDSKRCEFIAEDYTKSDLSSFDILFTFNDHSWNPEFELKLASECKGVLFSYSRVFLPKTLKKGKTYWIAGQPIVSYHLNIEEKDLFEEK